MSAVSVSPDAGKGLVGAGVNDVENACNADRPV
jgi:hypothetical protein